MHHLVGTAEVYGLPLTGIVSILVDVVLGLPLCGALCDRSRSLGVHGVGNSVNKLLATRPPAVDQAVVG